MQDKSNIFKNSGKTAYRVPEGYFDGLKSRLEAIPASNGEEVGALRRIKPYLALAACFFAIMLVGNVVLKSTVGEDVTTDYYSEMVYVDLIPAIQAEEYFHADTSQQESISDEDVINYLIDSGTSAELIEYAGLIAKK